MNKQVTLKGFVYECDYGLGEKSYSLYSGRNMGDTFTTLVGPAEFTFTLPEDYNPTAQQLAALEHEREQVRAAYIAKVAEINERIGKLQALTMDPAGA